MRVQEITASAVKLDEDILFVSKKLAAALRGAQEVLLMGATAGTAIMTAISESTNSDNLEEAVIYDATASEAVDEALTWLTRYFATELRRKGKRLFPHRFSAGYGDFELANQRIFYDTLVLSRLGISLTATHILTPEKSVTAICGIAG